MYMGLKSCSVSTSASISSFNFIFLLYSYLLIHSKLLIPFYLILVGTFYVHEFQGLFQVDTIPNIFEIAFYHSFSLVTIPVQLFIYSVI